MPHQPDDSGQENTVCGIHVGRFAQYPIVMNPGLVNEQRIPNG
jgi:hypothetical protein